MEKYKDYYKDVTDYSGDNGYSGIVQHGSSYGNEIDTSHFIDPTTKNNHDLAAYAIQAWENNWGYAWGTFGTILTPALLEYKARQYPDGVGKYRDFIEQNYLNRRTADCVGLIKSYGWYDAESGQISYGTHDMPDYSANQLYHTSVSNGTEHGSAADIPEIPGLILWKEGHTGIYIGDGYAIEAMSTSKGKRRWTDVGGRLGISCRTLTMKAR